MAALRPIREEITMTTRSGAKLGKAVLGITLAAVAFTASVSNAQADDYPSQPEAAMTGLRVFWGSCCPMA
jgi:Na+/melibiose symporter-like transporter